MAWYLQTYGINLGNMTRNATIMMPTFSRTHHTGNLVHWLYPWVFSKLIGTMLSGIGIFKRQTAQLFKELEA